MSSFIGFLAAFLTTVCWLPQAWRTIRSGDTRSISLSTQALFLTGVVSWAVYGALTGSAPVLIANILTAIPVAVILAIKVRNRNSDRQAGP